MKKIFKILIISILLLSIVSTIVMAKDDTLDNILKLGVVKVGICIDIPPIKFRDKDNNPAGICVDFAEALARDLGVKLEYIFTDWAGLIPTLLSGRSDVIIADMNRTLERAKAVNFTNAWITTGNCVVVMNDSKWKSLEDLNNKNTNIAAILGTNGEKHAKQAMPEVTVVTFNSNVEQQLALEQGRVDGLVNSQIFALRDVAKSDGKLRMIPELLTKNTYGFTLRPDDYRFLLWMNLWLENLKVTGEYDKLMNYWLLTNEWEKDYPGY